MMSASKTIKDMRIKLCLEQQKFADLLGITRVAICNYESGRRIPKLAIIRKMRALAKENGMDIPVEDFLN